jgi:hypothetical protein
LSRAAIEFEFDGAIGNAFLAPLVADLAGDLGSHRAACVFDLVG